MAFMKLVFSMPQHARCETGVSGLAARCQMY